MSEFPTDGLEGIVLTVADIDHARAWVDDQVHNLGVDLTKRGVTLDEQRRILNEMTGYRVLVRRADEARAVIASDTGDLAALAARADAGERAAVEGYALLRPFVRAIGSALGVRRGFVTITEEA